MTHVSADMGWNMHKNGSRRTWLQMGLAVLLLILATPPALATQSVGSDVSAPPLNLVIRVETEAEADVLRAMGVENARRGTFVYSVEQDAVLPRALDALGIRYEIAELQQRDASTRTLVAGLPLPQRAPRRTDPRSVETDLGQIKEQVVYLDFDGAEDVVYDGPIYVDQIDVLPFTAVAAGMGRQEDEIIEQIVSALEELYADTGVIFTTTPPATTSAYSTVFVGAVGDAFREFGSFLGLAEHFDAGNVDRSDNAFVLSDRMVPGHTDPEVLAGQLTNIIAEMIGLLLGLAEPGAEEASFPANGGFTHVRQHGSPGSESISVLPGTHTFIVNGILADNRQTKWFENGVLQETDPSCRFNGWLDPKYETDIDGTTVVRAEVHFASFFTCSTQDLEEVHIWNVTAAGVTALSWRSSASCNAGVISAAEAGDTVGVRVDAVGMSGEVVTVEIYEDDDFPGNPDDFKGEVDVTIGSSGCGTATWTVCWQDDKVGSPEYKIVYPGVPSSAEVLVTDNDPPSMPQLLEPDPGDVKTSPVDFDWSDSDKSGDCPTFANYQLQVDDSESFSSPQTYSSQDSDYQNVALETGTWWWRVRAFDTAGNPSAWTVSPPSFVVPGVIALSWRSSASCNAGVISAAEAGDTVGVRVDAVGMSGEVVTVEIYEDDDFPGNPDDFKGEVDVTIGSSGCGTATWTVCWQDDKVGSPEYKIVYPGVPSSAEVLVTDNDPPSMPQLLEPDPGDVKTSPVDFDWSDSDKSGDCPTFANYQLQVDDSESFSSPQTYSSEDSDYQNVPLGQGTWWWRVRAFDTAGNPSAWTLSPPSFVVAGVTELSWRSSASCNAGVISTAEAGNTVGVRVDAVGMNGQTITVQVWEVDFLWDNHIRDVQVTIGASGCGTGSWTACWENDKGGLGGRPEYELRHSGVASSHLQVLDTTPPEPSDLLTPADMDIIFDLLTELTWTAASDGDCGSGVSPLYQVWLDSDPSFDSPQIIPVFGLAHPLLTIVPAVYFWKVRAFDNEGNFSDSETQSFEIASLSISEAFRSSPVDTDGDLFATEFTLGWTTATSLTTPRPVYAKFFYLTNGLPPGEEFAIEPHQYTVIKDDPDENLQEVSINITTAGSAAFPRTLHSLRIRVYDASSDELLDTIGGLTDADLLLVPLERGGDGTELPNGRWTIISHGLSGPTYGDMTEPGGWMRELGERIQLESPAGGESNVAIHTMDASAFTIAGDVEPDDPTKHHVLLFDWQGVSNLTVNDPGWFPSGCDELGKLFGNIDRPPANAVGEDGYAEASADALYALLHKHGLHDKVYAVIGYSRGGVIATELVQRLILEDEQYAPTQMIFLDPEGGAYGGELYSDSEFNAWSGVSHNANYYEVGIKNLPPLDCLGGNPVPGARNYNVNALFDLDLAVYTHTCFHDYFIRGAPFGVPFISTCPFPLQHWDASGESGMYLRDSLIVTQHTPTDDSPGEVPSATELDRPDPFELFNGNFAEDPADDSNGLFNSTAGWFYHNGATDAAGLQGTVVNGTLRLLDGQYRTHNWAFVPPMARTLVLNVEIDSPAQGSQLKVWWSTGPENYGELVASIPTPVAGPLSYAVPLPENVPGSVGRLTFKFEQGGFARLDNMVWSAAPANDSCGSAIVVGVGTVPFSTLNATTDGPDEPAACTASGDSQIASDVWYRYVAECSGEVSISLCGSNYNTRLGVYGDSCPSGNGTIIVCNDDSCGTNAEVQFTAVAANEYLIRIGGFMGAQGSGTMTINHEGPLPPASVNASDGADCLAVQLSWEEVLAAESYEVWRHSSNDPILAERIAEVMSATSYVDYSASVDVTYFYWIVAVSKCGPGDFGKARTGYRANCDISGPDGQPDGILGINDFLQLLAAWGPCNGCPEDLNGDGNVDYVDLVILLCGWDPDWDPDQCLPPPLQAGPVASAPRTTLINDDVLAPAELGGLFEVDGDYQQTAAGLLSIEIGGLVPIEDYDILVINGNANLNGVIVAEFVDGFVPSEEDEFTILVAGSIDGAMELLEDQGHLPLYVETTGDRVIVRLSVLDDAQRTPDLTIASQGASTVADLNNDGRVDIADVLIVLEWWGLYEPNVDLTQDGIVDGSDLLAVLQGWELN